MALPQEMSLNVPAYPLISGITPRIPIRPSPVSAFCDERMKMRRLAVTVATLVALAFTGSAVAAAGWTPAQAAAKVKATYVTVDQKTYDWAKQHDYASAMAAALHGAKPTAVTCKGPGTAGARYSRFHCTVQVKSVMAPIPPDYVLFTATKKLTVTVAGSRWRIVNGWR